MFIMRLAIWFLVILDFPDISRVVAVPTCISIFSFEYVNVFWSGSAIWGLRLEHICPVLPPRNSVPGEHFNDVVFFEFRFIYAVICVPRLVYPVVHYIILAQFCKINMWQWLLLLVGHAALLAHTLHDICCMLNSICGFGPHSVSLLSWFSVFSILLSVFSVQLPSVCALRAATQNAGAQSVSPPCAKYK